MYPMKYLHLQATILCMLLVFTAACQVIVPVNQHPVEKPSLFNQLPDKFICPLSTLQNIFASGLNNRLSTDLGNQLHIEGIVLAKVAVTAQQLSINIRCTNFQNALLNISRLSQPDGSFKYAGRIVSPNHGDVLLLWEENGQYSFIKQKQLLTMVE
jgi:hypothetical protein